MTPLTFRVRNLTDPAHAQEATFERDVITIGRDPSNVLVLPDEKKVVSRQHAALRCGPDMEITDLGSHNATYVNDRRLQPNQPFPVRYGDIVRIGDFAVEILTASPILKRPTVSLTGAVPPGLPEGASTQPGPAPLRPGDGLTEMSDRESLSRAVAELRVLNELALAIGGARDTQMIVKQIVQASVQAIHASQGDITLVEEKTRDSAHTMIRTMEGPGEAFHMSEFLLAWMLEERGPILLNDPHEHTLFSNAGWSRGIRCLLAVPLIVRSRMIGILSLYNKKDPGGFTEADQRLLGIIAAQSAQVIENARLIEEERRYLEMQQQMRVAFEIQMNLLPKDVPAVPGYDIAGISHPAHTVGGDYFDYIGIEDGRIAVCVGDVAGKGLPAALVMSNLQATLRAQTYWSSSVKECLEGANNLLYRSTNKRTFVTLFYGVLDHRTHRFRYANAGHNKPLFLRPGYAPSILTAGGLALGLRPGSQYPEQELALEPGDVLLIYSDGVTEAADPEKNQFELERLSDLLRRHAHEPSRLLVQRVADAVQQYARGELQADDMTILALKRLP